MEEIIKELNKNGFRINNLFQLGDGFWRCNVRKDNRDGTAGAFFEFANGTTAEEALYEALAKTKCKPVEDDFSDLLV